MKIHEYQAKRLFSDYGIPVEKHILCHSEEDAIYAYTRLGIQRSVVKAHCQRCYLGSC